ncbi:MAG: hypothetical protein IT299_07135 [Dehalococcoidia bacterium]|nr:hypothetical protein [Dehalococcoidia bacterium]
MGLLTQTEPATRPLVTLDFDGVICAPFFGLNYGIHRGFLQEDAPPEPATIPAPWFSRVADHVRFDLRRPLPDATTGLEALAGLARVVIVTGRRTSPEGWLRRHHLEEYIESITINEGPLRSPHFKLAALEAIRPLAHVDDDPRTVQLLARHTGVDIYLRDWPRNRDLRYEPRIVRIATLHDLTARLRALHGSAASRLDIDSRPR